MHRVMISAVVLVAIMIAAIGMSSTAGAAASRSCGKVTATRDHTTSSFSVQIAHGHVSCKEARDAIKAYNSGKGILHKPPHSGRGSWFTTLPGGWSCSSGAGGDEGCSRGPKINSYERRDEVYASPVWS